MNRPVIFKQLKCLKRSYIDIIRFTYSINGNPPILRFDSIYPPLDVLTKRCVANVISVVKKVRSCRCCEQFNQKELYLDNHRLEARARNQNSGLGLGVRPRTSGMAYGQGVGLWTRNKDQGNVHIILDLHYTRKLLAIHRYTHVCNIMDSA